VADNSDNTVIEDLSKGPKNVDTYLESLKFFAKLYQKNVSDESLVSGILMQNSFMDLNTFTKAGSRVGLISKVAKRSLDEISPLALPALIILKNDQACILLNIDFENNKASIIMPDFIGETIISLEQLKSEYANTIVFIKNDYRFKNKLHQAINLDNPKQWFWGAMKKNRPIYVKIALVAVLINMFVIATPLFTMNVYDRVLPNNAIDTLWVLAIGISIVMIFDFILKLIRSSYLGLANKRADILMSNKIFDQLLNIRLDQKPASTGMFLSRLQSFESVRDFFSTATMATIVDLPFIFIFIGIIFFIGGPIGWISIATIIIAFSFSWYMQTPIKEVISKSAKEEQIKMTALNETVAGLEIIKAVRGQNRMKTQFDNALNQTAYFTERSQALSQSVTYFTSFIAQFSNIVIVITGVYLASEGKMTMGAIIASMMLNGRVISPVSQIVSLLLRYDRTMLSYQNINELMSMERERENKVYLSRPNLNGDIVFKDINFAYKNQNFNALSNINLTIKSGEKVAIIGKIGSGKSTLLKLLMNLYTPTSGSVMYDNTDVRQIDPVDLRRVIGYVPQEPFLFLGTVKDNITIGEHYTSDEDLLEVARIAGLDKFLNKHEAGFELLVGERGDGLSGGERQSITLARALVSKPHLLIMDEPTNSMDSQTERAFINNMKGILKDQTLIVMTHKMSILDLVDRVIIMHEGKIVADGPKEKILNNLKSEKDS